MLTNRFGLPEEIVNALSKNRYTGDDGVSSYKTDYSITTLISPVQQTILRKRYPDCNSEDVSDRIWSMFGHLAHNLLEEHGSDDAITEKRFYAVINGRTISGQIDNYKQGIITDYKTTSIYKIQKKSYEEWEKQLNCYAWLVKKNGLPVRNLRIIAIIRDHQASRVNIPDYPKTPILEIPLTLWTEEEQQEFIDVQVGKLLFAEQQSDDSLLPCSKEDRWMDESKWAVIKCGAKRATKVFDTHDEAADYTDKMGLDYNLEERPGAPRRCLAYCNVSSMCSQHQAWLKENSDGQE